MDVKERLTNRGGMIVLLVFIAALIGMLLVYFLGGTAMMQLAALVIGISVPLGAWGGIDFLRRIMAYQQVRNGKVKCVFLSGSWRHKKVFLRPKNGSMKHNKKTYKYDKKLLTYEGNTPVAYFIEDSTQQVDFNLVNRGAVSPDMLSLDINMAFMLGKKAQAQQDKLLMMCCFVAAGAAALGCLLIFGMTNSLTEILAILHAGIPAAAQTASNVVR